MLRLILSMSLTALKWVRAGRGGSVRHSAHALDARAVVLRPDRRAERRRRQGRSPQPFPAHHGGTGHRWRGATGCMYVCAAAVIALCGMGCHDAVRVMQ